MYCKRNGTPYTNEAGNPACIQWAKDSENVETKIVKQTELPNGKWVSTVWLGLDHSMNGKPPLIFETMVFPKKGNYRDEDLRRYSSEEEATKGHEEMCRKWENTDML